MRTKQDSTAIGEQTEVQRAASSVDSLRTAEIRTHAGLAGTELRCTSGLIWVTIEGDPNDYLLSKNKAVRVSTAGKVVVSGKGGYRIVEEGRIEKEYAAEP